MWFLTDDLELRSKMMMMGVRSLRGLWLDSEFIQPFWNRLLIYVDQRIQINTSTFMTNLDIYLFLKVSKLGGS